MGRLILNVGCFWLCLFSIQFGLLAQDPEPRFTTFSSKDGLSQTVVNTIYQDRKNYMWFGTQDGLNRFDGFNFKVFRFDPEDSASISDNWVAWISMEDSDGDIWMVTGDFVVNVYNPRNESFQKLNPVENKPGKLPPFQRTSMIAQDKSGMVWVSTNRGLFRVNKKNWVVTPVFINKEEKPRLFFRFFEDRDHNLWFSSNNGLLVYNTKKAEIKFDTFSKDPAKSLAVTDVMADQQNNILVFTNKEVQIFNPGFQLAEKLSFSGLLLPEELRKKEILVKAVFPFVKEIEPLNYLIATHSGLVHFDLRNKKFKSFLPSGAKGSVSGSEITAIFKDRNNEVWIGTTKGLDKFDFKTQTFSRVSVCDDSEISGGVLDILDDKDGNIWVVDLFGRGEGNRLCLMDKQKMQLTRVKRNPANPNSIPTEFVIREFRDKEGNSWFGTFGSGVFRISPFQKKFRILKHKAQDVNSLKGESAWAMAEDNKGRVWITLHLDGLDCYDPQKKLFTHYGDRLKKFLNRDNVVIISLVCDKQNNLWIGTLGFGLIKFNPNTDRMEHYYAGKGSANPISDNYVSALSLDKQGNVIISYANFGFDILNTETGKFSNHKNDSEITGSFKNNSVRAAIQDSRGDYWVSFDGAIGRFNPKTGKMAYYLSKKNKGKGIIADKAFCIFEDSKKRIWVGTHGGGLSLYDRQKDEFLYWTEKDGLINNVIYGILEDTSGKLWLSTNSGLSCFDPATEKFVSYYESDGLQAGEFNANSYLKTKDGTLYFGGIQGITCFNPAEIVPDMVAPKVTISGFQVYNQKVEVIQSAKAALTKNFPPGKLIEMDGHLYLPGNISYTNELAIDYEHKVITFEYAALKFDMPERCTFMYKMEGFENDWNIAGNRRFATYTNLPPGDYVFKVTAANADGIYNTEPAKIRIIIKPPFYLTWWFITFSIASLIVASTSYVMKREKNLKRTKSILEEKVRNRTHELNEKNEELVLRNIQILKQKEEIAAQAKRLRFELDVQNVTSEQALLRSQINPHFLFNTLNNIYSLVYKKSDNAPEALMKLSDIMRYMLYDTSSDKVLLEKEVQYLKSFIELHQLRLKNRDFVSFDITGDPAGKQIAPMLLIAFVENAFKHGNKTVPAPGIQITLDCRGENIKFGVKNYKNASAAKDSLGGIGLTNVKRRLELIYHDDYKLDIKDMNDKFEVELVIKEKQLT